MLADIWKRSNMCSVHLKDDKQTIKKLPSSVIITKLSKDIRKINFQSFM